MTVKRLIGSLVAILIWGCGGNAEAPPDVEKQAFDDMRAEVRAIIEDPQREDLVVALVDRMQSEYQNLRDTAEARRKALRELNADYDATREQFAEYLDKYNAELVTRHKAFRESHRALIESTTAEEWSALAKSNTKSMGKLAESFSSI